MSDITEILEQIESGDASATDQLLPLVYDELRRLARAQMASQSPGQTLQATALVHEAYIRLMRNASGTDQPSSSDLASLNADAGRPVEAVLDGREAQAGWQGRGHFFVAAGEAMRRILIDHARSKAAQKRGGGRRPAQLVDVASPETMDPSDLLALDDALKRLAQAYPRHAQLVELQFFAGLSQQEAAACLEISVATARRHWIFARAWLFQQLAAPAR